MVMHIMLNAMHRESQADVLATVVAIFLNIVLQRNFSFLDERTVSNSKVANDCR